MDNSMVLTIVFIAFLFGIYVGQIIKDDDE